MKPVSQPYAHTFEKYSFHFHFSGNRPAAKRAQVTNVFLAASIAWLVVALMYIGQGPAAEEPAWCMCCKSSGIQLLSMKAKCEWTSSSACSADPCIFPVLLACLAVTL
jgi:hypothetical protein